MLPRVRITEAAALPPPGYTPVMAQLASGPFRLPLRRAADLLGISPKTLRAWIRRGLLDAKQPGTPRGRLRKDPATGRFVHGHQPDNRRIYIERDELVRFLAGRDVA